MVENFLLISFMGNVLFQIAVWKSFLNKAPQRLAVISALAYIGVVVTKLASCFSLVVLIGGGFLESRSLTA